MKEGLEQCWRIEVARSRSWFLLWLDTSVAVFILGLNSEGKDHKFLHFRRQKFPIM